MVTLLEPGVEDGLDDVCFPFLEDTSDPKLAFVVSLRMLHLSCPLHPVAASRI